MRNRAMVAACGTCWAAAAATLTVDLSEEDALRQIVLSVAITLTLTIILRPSDNSASSTADLRASKKEIADTAFQMGIKVGRREAGPRLPAAERAHRPRPGRHRVAAPRRLRLVKCLARPAAVLPATMGIVVALTAAALPNAPVTLDVRPPVHVEEPEVTVSATAVGRMVPLAGAALESHNLSSRTTPDPRPGAPSPSSTGDQEPPEQEPSPSGSPTPTPKAADPTPAPEPPTPSPSLPLPSPLPLPLPSGLLPGSG